MNFAERILKMSNLTSEQVDAITYAHMDTKATNKLLTNIASNIYLVEPSCHLQCEELANATDQTLEDLEKAFPFLLVGVEDE